MTSPALPVIAAHTFKSALSGPRFLVLGAIHGNETCGPTAMRQIIPALEQGDIPLLKGEVTFIPVCNPRAYAEKTRFIEQNLNRIFKPRDEPASYEAQLANILTSYVDACDYILDLHTMTTTGGAFVFLDYEEPDFAAFALAQGVSTIVRGWPQVQSAVDSLNEADTISYARSKGKIGTLVECGQHGALEADAIARTSILSSLAYLEMIPQGYAAPPPLPLNNIRVTRAIFRKQDGKFTRDWCHLDPIFKGDVIAVYADGTTETADHDGRILIPKAETHLGHEWFYVGREEA